jgi:hypothetical protein
LLRDEVSGLNSKAWRKALERMKRPTVGIMTAPNFMSQAIIPAVESLAPRSLFMMFASRTTAANGCFGETIMQMFSLLKPD